MGRFLLCASACLISLCNSANALSAASFEVIITGNTITWGSGTSGYLQVQDASNWISQCEGLVSVSNSASRGSPDIVSCTVTPGTYNVLNHSTRQRINNVVAGQQDGVYTAPELDGVPTDSEPYQVIEADTIFVPASTLPAPANLTVQVYSQTAAELFRDRAVEPGLQYTVFAGSALLGSTDGTSLFIQGLTVRTLDPFSQALLLI